MNGFLGENGSFFTTCLLHRLRRRLRRYRVPSCRRSAPRLPEEVREIITQERTSNEKGPCPRPYLLNPTGIKNSCQALAI